MRIVTIGDTHPKIHPLKLSKHSSMHQRIDRSLPDRLSPIPPRIEHHLPNSYSNEQHHQRTTKIKLPHPIHRTDNPGYHSQSEAYGIDTAIRRLQAQRERLFGEDKHVAGDVEHGR